MVSKSSRHKALVEIKKRSLLRAYQLFKKAEAEGTLRQIPLTEEQRKIIQCSP